MLSKGLKCACAAAAALIGWTAPAGAAIGGGATKARIPFEFVVSGRSMPAGDYTFEIKSGNPVVAMRDSQGRSVHILLSRQPGNSLDDRNPRFVFHKQDGKFVLREVVSSKFPK